MNHKATGIDQWLLETNISVKAERLFIQVVWVGTPQYFIDALYNDIL